MRQKFDVTLTDGTKLEVQTGWADALAVEDRFDVPMARFGQEMRGRWMTYMAWHAAHRRGQTALEFDDFLAQVEEFDPIAAEAGGEPGEATDGSPA